MPSSILDRIQVGQTLYLIRDTQVVGDTIAPVYDNTQTYGVGVACSHDGLVYKCVVPITVPEAWDASHWAQTYALGEVSGKADKQDTVLNTSLSRGRKASTTIANGSVAFGNNVEASALYAFAIGSNTVANALCAVAIGDGTSAFGEASVSEGKYTIADFECAHAEGTGTRAYGKNMHAFGKYNAYDLVDNWDEWVSETPYVVGDKVKVTDGTTVTGWRCIEANSDAVFDDTKWEEDDTDDYAIVVGNGTSDSVRSNAYVLGWDGTARYSGDVYVGCNSDSSGGNKLATEQYSDLGDVITPSSPIPIPSANSSATYDMSGITEAHTLLLWRFNNSAENDPPLSLSYTTYNGYFTITNTSSFASNETIKPVFVRMKGTSATQHT